MHKYKLSNQILSWALLILCLLGLSAPAVLAATPPTPPANFGQALEIAPPVIYLSVSPGQTASTQIALRDVSPGDLIVTGQANDFVAAGEDGTPKILLDDTASENNPYSLKSWVAAPASLHLIPKEIKSMTVTLHVPANATPGGHYGIIRFTATPPSLSNSGVSLSTSLGALMLVTVSGNVTENLSVQELSVNRNGKTGKLFESGPLNFVVKFKNSGNVHEQPVGQIAITDMFGKKFAGVNVNLPPKSVLPQSVRKFEQPLDRSVIGNKRLFGRYKATLTATYGTDNKKTTSASITFWVIPYRLIGAAIVVLIAGFFGLRYLIKRYNRYVVSRSNRQQK